MKRIIILFICLLLITGCGKNKSSNVLKEVNKELDKASGYKLVGDLEITNNDEVYKYDVVVDYQKEDFYKVMITNKDNQFMQVILKNQDGVFLLTPSLNKSFKFQSDWPYNNSQVYLPNTIINDIEKDKDKTFSVKDDTYIYNTSVHFNNNSRLVKQKVVFDKDYHLKKVVVYDNQDIICMEFNVSKITFSPKYDKDYFELETIVNPGDVRTRQTSNLDDVVYPLFLPDGTKLVNEEIVTKENGERVIMTYDGEKNFLLVEETIDVFNDFTVIPSSGEPYQLMDTIGVMNDNSLSWLSGNTEYYLVSDVMSQEELVEVAESIVDVISMK